MSEENPGQSPKPMTEKRGQRNRRRKARNNAERVAEEAKLGRTKEAPQPKPVEEQPATPDSARELADAARGEVADADAIAQAKVGTALETGVISSADAKTAHGELDTEKNDAVRAIAAAEAAALDDAKDVSRESSAPSSEFSPAEVEAQRVAGLRVAFLKQYSETGVLPLDDTFEGGVLGRDIVSLLPKALQERLAQLHPDVSAAESSPEPALESASKMSAWRDARKKGRESAGETGEKEAEKGAETRADQLKAAAIAEKIDATPPEQPPVTPDPDAAEDHAKNAAAFRSAVEGSRLAKEQRDAETPEGREAKKLAKEKRYENLRKAYAIEKDYLLAGATIEDRRKALAEHGWTEGEINGILKFASRMVAEEKALEKKRKEQLKEAYETEKTELLAGATVPQRRELLVSFTRWTTAEIDDILATASRMAEDVKAGRAPAEPAPESEPVTEPTPELPRTDAEKAERDKRKEEARIIEIYHLTLGATEQFRRDFLRQQRAKLPPGEGWSDEDIDDIIQDSARIVAKEKVARAQALKDAEAAKKAMAETGASTSAPTRAEERRRATAEFVAQQNAEKAARMQALKDAEEAKKAAEAVREKTETATADPATSRSSESKKIPTPRPTSAPETPPATAPPAPPTPEPPPAPPEPPVEAPIVPVTETDLERARAAMIKIETAIEGRRGITGGFRSLGASLRETFGGRKKDKVEDMEKELALARAEYERLRVEAVGDHLSSQLQERMTLTDERAEARAKQRGVFDVMVKAMKWLGDKNLLAALDARAERKGSAKIESRFARVVLRIASLRLVPTVVLLGVGGAAGAGLNVGLLGMQRVLSGAGMSAGIYNMLRSSSKAKEQHLDAGKVTRAVKLEGPGAISEQEIFERIRNAEARAVLDGEKISDNKDYKRLVEAYITRVGERITAAMREAHGATEVDLQAQVERLRSAQTRHRIVALLAGGLVGSGVVAYAMRGVFGFGGGASDAAHKTPGTAGAHSAGAEAGHSTVAGGKIPDSDMSGGGPAPEYNQKYYETQMSPPFDSSTQVSHMDQIMSRGPLPPDAVASAATPDAVVASSATATATADAAVQSAAGVAAKAAKKVAEHAMEAKHVIKPGDTVWGIAKHALRERMGPDFDKLSPGQQGRLISQVDQYISDHKTELFHGGRTVSDIDTVHVGTTLDIGKAVDHFSNEDLVKAAGKAGKKIAKHVAGEGGGGTGAPVASKVPQLQSWEEVAKVVKPTAEHLAQPVGEADTLENARHAALQTFDRYLPWPKEELPGSPFVDTHPVFLTELTAPFDGQQKIEAMHVLAGAKKGFLRFLHAMGDHDQKLMEKLVGAIPKGGRADALRLLAANWPPHGESMIRLSARLSKLTPETLKKLTAIFDPDSGGAHKTFTMGGRLLGYDFTPGKNVVVGIMKADEINMSESIEVEGKRLKDILDALDQISKK